MKDETPLIPLSFIKKIYKNSFFDLLSELKRYSQIHEYDLVETVYVFTRETIIKDLFFLMNEDIRDEILFISISWAATVEKTKKTKPKNAKEIRYIKDNPFFTQLEQELIKCIHRNYNLSEQKGSLELNKYLLFFYELLNTRKVPQIDYI